MIVRSDQPAHQTRLETKIRHRLMAGEHGPRLFLSSAELVAARWILNPCLSNGGNSVIAKARLCHQGAERLIENVDASSLPSMRRAVLTRGQQCMLMQVLFGLLPEDPSCK